MFPRRPLQTVSDSSGEPYVMTHPHLPQRGDDLNAGFQPTGGGAAAAYIKAT